MPLEQPHHVVPLPPLRQFQPQFLDVPERPQPEKLRLQGAGEPLDAAVALRGAHEGRSCSWLASGDRHEADGQPYCYQRGTHRLASVGPTTYSWREDGSLARRESPDGAALTFCYDGQGRVASTVGAGGDVNRLVTNFRRQRVAEVWPVNGLREDFMVDEASRLLSEEGVASLGSQYPRPVREYVWLGAHPVAVLEASESAAGLVTSRGVTFVHSGHLGEVLSETDEGGHVVRQSLTTPFGERVEVSPPAVPLAAETPNPYSSYSTEVAVAGVRALKLHFTEVELASCDAIVLTDGSGGPEVARVPSTASGEVWTEWLPTSSASVTLRAEGCGQARGFRLVEALPQWGAVHVEARGESTANPYPAGGQRFQVSLGTGGYVKLTNVTVASCDEVEARAPTGEVLWRWKPAVAWARAWSGRLSGDVEVGIWGEGCNATERKGGFTLAEVRLEEAAGAPLPLGLPGQKQRPDGTWDNWHRTYMAEVGRYLAPEPLQQSPAYVMSMAAGGMQAPAYAYAENNPLMYVDINGLGVVRIQGAGWFQDAVNNYLASPCGSGVSAIVAASPLDVNVSMGVLPDIGSYPDFGNTSPNSTTSPSAVNVVVNAFAMGQYKTGAYGSYRPTAYHNVTELIAHEFGHVEGIMLGTSGWTTFPRFWWPTLNPATNCNSCAAGRAYRISQGWSPFGHDEVTRDCSGRPAPVPVCR